MKNVIEMLTDNDREDFTVENYVFEKTQIFK